jgi:predicted nucleotidyltransferase
MCPRCKSRLWDVPKIRPVHLGKGLGTDDILTPHRDPLLRLARTYGARRLLVFGSVRREEATDHSDLDLLVEWRRTPSFLDPASLAEDIERVVGRSVGLVNRGDLHRARSPQVEAEAVPI